jgi:HEPN domain-containing protein
MSVELVIAGYVRIARQDLDGARILNAGANRNAAYLCEQAAEKLIRAVLTSERIQAGIRHELPDMVAQIPDTNPVKPLLRAIENLDVYATAYRYPSPKGRVKNPDARRGRRVRHEDRAGTDRDRVAFLDRSLEARGSGGKRRADSLNARCCRGRGSESMTSQESAARGGAHRLT